MKETNTLPFSAPDLIATLPKEKILAELTGAYTASKPINDSMVDISLKIQALTAEVYRRSIFKQLPDVPMTRTRTVMKAACTVHPNKGLPMIAQRLQELKTNGIEIVSVNYDENTGEYTFLAKPEFELPAPPV